MDQQSPPMAFGSGAPLLGQDSTAAINAAQQRRGMGAGATSQVSPSAPTFNPATQQPTGQLPQQGAPTTQPMPQDTGAAQQPQMNAMGQMGNPDDTLIIKALAEKMKHNSLVQKIQMTGSA